MSYRRILVPVDGSRTSNKALVAALELARERGGSVRVVHALDELALVAGLEYSAVVMQAAREQADKALDDALAIVKAAGVEGDSRLIDAPGQRLGEAVAAEAAAWKADLVVVGTHGRRGIGRILLGSGAESVIRMSAVPVLVIRGEGDD
ncbi:universal stress protein [Ramlibacter sp.]|uniref:universal stress protein n=1 Tax=Ramlibacter sp. TaxID=1917967 RepID=UPI003D148C1A